MNSDSGPADERRWEEALRQAFAAPAGPELGAVDRVSLRLGRPSRVALRPPEQESPARLELAPRNVDWDVADGGRYRVLGQVARGGIGTILLARDTDLGREVAVKVLHPEHAEHPELLHRFVEEAQIGAQLQHPGIVPVYELGLDQRHRPYFTMPYVRGESLAALLARGGRTPERTHRLLQAFVQVCGTVAFAHSRGVVHRDLKPGNVMVGPFGEVLVMDWGLAKVLGRADTAAARGADPAPPPLATVRTGTEAFTVTGAILGTPAYMPPEQARGDVDAVDARSDVFALGAILCEILTGAPPYPGSDALRRATDADLSEARARLAGCGAEPDLVELATACLAAEPQARPPAAGPVQERVAAWLAAAQARAETARTAAASAAARARAEHRSRNLALALGAALTVLVLGAGTALWWRRDRVQRIAGQVQAALRETFDRLTQAEPALALAAVQRAETLVRTGDVAAGLAGEVANARARVGAALRAEEIEVRVAELRLAPDAAGREALAEYPRLLARLELPDPAAAGFAEAVTEWSAAHRSGLARGLEDWALRLRREPDGARRGAELLRAADALDPEALRLEIRAAIRAPGLDALRAVAGGIPVAETDPESLHLLASALHLGGAREEATKLLQDACTQHPTSFWLNHRLA
ncbi:MAG: serine/threonine protein kinase, partial [Planctomycetes bacterium]|nr:serine/threonine protein kinase [Planctomycetota bacterium]